jgi:hypothetical protein
MPAFSKNGAHEKQTANHKGIGVIVKLSTRTIIVIGSTEDSDSLFFNIVFCSYNGPFPGQIQLDILMRGIAVYINTLKQYQKIKFFQERLFSKKQRECFKNEKPVV